MVSNPIKFRCYNCSQLLGAARTRAGKVITCTRCGAELIVPEPPPAEPQPQQELAAGESQNSVADLGITLDFRPEDIRVAPEFQHVVSETIIAAAEPPPETESVVDEPAPVVVSPAQTRPARRARSLAPEEPPESEPEDDTDVIPPIEIDATPRRRSAQPVPAATRSRDLVIPRSVVASWSLFVILALFFTFLAGLLAGHYIWRYH